MKPTRIALFLLVFLLLLGVLSLGIHNLTQDNNLGTDFYIFWQAGRAVLLENATPYSDEIAVRSQLAIFKRLSLPNEDQLAFVYPPFALIPIFPLALLPFDWAQAVWISFLLLSLVTAFALAFARAPRWAGLSLLLFYPVFFGLILGNFAVLIAGLLTLTAGYNIFNPRPSPAWQTGAGLMAAWLAVKPQFTWPYLLFLLLLALKRKQPRFLAALVLGGLGLLLLSFWFVPNWPAEWLGRISRYTTYNQAWPIIVFLLKDWLPLSIATIAAVVTGLGFAGLSAWWIVRWWRDRLDPLSLLAWLSFTGYLFHPRGASYEHIAFLLPLAWWICLRPAGRAWAAPAWWIATFIVSWLAFFLSTGPGWVSATEWPLLFHALWLIWLLVKDQKSRQVAQAG